MLEDHKKKIQKQRNSDLKLNKPIFSRKKNLGGVFNDVFQRSNLTLNRRQVLDAKKNCSGSEKVKNGGVKT